MPQTREHVTLIKQLGIKHLVVFINKCDAADEEMIELVEMEIRELLDTMGFSEESTPIVKGSALCALEDTKPDLGEKAIEELMSVVDETIPTPERDLEVPFLMPIDHVHNIQGRGCVITGRLERGKLKVGQDIEILGYSKVVTNIFIDSSTDTFDAGCQGKGDWYRDVSQDPGGGQCWRPDGNVGSRNQTYRC